MAVDDATGIAIDVMAPADWPAVRAIYEEGIATGTATFETDSPSWEQWDAAHREECRFVARRDGDVVGWIALSRVSKRHVYRGVAEVSVYVAAAARGSGIGRALFDALIPASEAAGVWTIQAGVIADNERSLRLHQRAGFRRVGVRERFGRDRDGQWRDVVLLERRSAVVGGDFQAG
ncbi:MAG TPA: GNAT family N-acetyltransferase [Candidatus Limnocylindrales bacterium]|nr:GNAT family N-acetyltransferase [Candidatus Limnocylindrales bacterium]